MNCPRPGKECNEFMCGSSVDGICQRNEIKCDFCSEIYNAEELNKMHPIDRYVVDCITFDKEDNAFNLWHESEDDYYTGNIMEINYCPVCGRKLSNA